MWPLTKQNAEGAPGSVLEPGSWGGPFFSLLHVHAHQPGFTLPVKRTNCSTDGWFTLRFFEGRVRLRATSLLRPLHHYPLFAFPSHAILSRCAPILPSSYRSRAWPSSAPFSPLRSPRRTRLGSRTSPPGVCSTPPTCRNP